MKVIFLDVDGVLNGYSKMTGIIFDICKKLHILKLVRKRYDIFGIHNNKVRRLSKIVKSTGAKVVISSSWRHSWYIPYEKKTHSQKLLHDKLCKYNIEVIGITDTISNQEHHSYRELEIKDWLSKHNNVDKFVILDDEQFDLPGFIGKELVKTSDTDYIRGYWYENTGLKRKHVKRAINILNK